MTKTYDIIVVKKGTESHSVNADSPQHAFELFNAGASTLKGDETDSVDRVKIVDRETGATFDPDFFEIDAEDPDEEREFTVTIRVTARVSAEETIMATSIQDAAVKAANLDPHDFLYTYSTDDGFDGDPIAMVCGELHDQDEVEVDLRPVGEPFSWTACDIVKKLAALPEGAITYDKLATVADLIQQARQACEKNA